MKHTRCITPGGESGESLSILDGRVAAEGVSDAWTLDLKEHLIFPGLVNAHDHLHRNNIPPLPQSAPFANSYAWMEAFQPYFCEPEVARACAVPAPLRYWQGGWKNLLCGATTVAHHDPWHPVLDDPDFPVRLLRHYGWSHSLGLSPHSALQKRERAKYAVGCYGPPVAESFAATPPEEPWFIHLAEGTDAIAAEELAHLEALGCLAANTRLIHGVGLREADREKVIAHGAGVIWCPGSNLSLFGQTLDPRPLFEAGCLALGTDSRLTGARDLLDELCIAAAESDLGPMELLQLVTACGSRLLRMPEVGGLAPGQAADLLVMGYPGGDPQRALLGLRRADIRAVVRAGKPAIADPDFADWFAYCQVEAIPVRLDGRPKLCVAALLGTPGSAALEPGLEIEG
ncbi:MAG TPA: amidohydrolase family protein [Chthonomonadaceae bacterium]|nr:amidohydrolase family protein [Chthonomonadaceae bacterium]